MQSGMVLVMQSGLVSGMLLVMLLVMQSEMEGFVPWVKLSVLP